MTLDFSARLDKMLEMIKFAGNYQGFVVHDKDEQREDHDEIISLYGKVKWKIADLLNQNYSMVNVDLYNWLDENENDEVSYFLNEAGSNSLNYSEFKAPSGFHLWLGEKGFILAIEQRGKGFDAENINEKRIKKNEGRAFEFFRNCKGRIFFDDPKNAKIIFMAVNF